MAEAIVSLLLQKLRDEAFLDVLYRYGQKDNIDSVARKLSYIMDFLRDAESKRTKDERVHTWVMEVVNIAYRIEDCTDMFQCEMLNQRDGVSKRSVIRRIFQKNRTILIMHYLRSELSIIRERMEKLSETVVKFGFQALDGGSSHKVWRPVTQIVLGNSDNSNDVISQLLDRSTTRRSVVSIVGCRGIGKTSLAGRVYKSARVKKEFEELVWLSITQEFNLIYLLKKMFARFQPTNTGDNNELTEDYLIGVLNSYMSQKKYLVVIDDVRTKDMFSQLEEVLPDTNNGSRVLITCRFFDVVKAIDPQNKPFELPLLNIQKSTELLLSKAFPFKKQRETYPPDVWDLAKEFAGKSSGLPLQLVVLGTFLSTKSYTSWIEVMNSMDWVFDGKNYLDIITDYQDMPPILRPFFMTLSVFPEGYGISVNSLISYWTLEGFLPHDVLCKTNDEAQSYLEELVKRSMVQVVSRCCNGAMKSCRVHPLVRTLAVLEAKKLDFVCIYENGNNNNNHSASKRVAIHYTKSSIDDNSFESINKERDIVGAHFIFNFGPSFSIENKLLLVQILELQGTKNLTYLDEAFRNMINLKFLSMRNSGIYEVPESIKFLGNLETLDVRDTFIESVPESIWTIKTLKCVKVSDWVYLVGPPSKSNLPNLHTAKTIHVPRSWIKELPNLPALRKLGLSYFRNANNHDPEPDWDFVARFLGILTNLVSVKIQGTDVIAKLIDANTSPSYQNIKSLWLGGSRSLLDLTGSNLPMSLVKLTLENLKFEQDPMPQLEKLPELQVLRLRWLLFNIKLETMNCTEGRFLQLKRLEFHQNSGIERCSFASVLPKIEHVVVNGNDETQTYYPHLKL